MKLVYCYDSREQIFFFILSVHIYSVAIISPLGLMFKPESPSFKDVLSKVWLKLALCFKVLTGKCEKFSMKMTLIRKAHSSLHLR